jgi:peptidyl-prolyl cis-trans isomerase B (cyclophilin B)
MNVIFVLGTSRKLYHKMTLNWAIKQALETVFNSPRPDWLTKALYTCAIAQYHERPEPEKVEKNTMKQLISLVAVLIFSSSVAFAQSDADNPQVTIHTSHGDIRLELYPQKSPRSVENFLQYASDGFFDGTVFHRIISHFMIQGGGMEADLVRKPTRDPIINEADNGLKNLRGTVAMARTGDVNSATAQFFINVEINGALDYTSKENSRTWGYAVFGRVIDGMDVVDDIRFVETGPRDVPVEAVIIESVEIH